MKRLLVIIGLLLLVGILSTACADAEVSEPAEDIPRYTADQVIAVAEAAYPEIPSVYPQCKDLSWRALYIGNGVWLVAKSCIDQYGANQGVMNSWYFYESNGAFAPK